MKFSKNSLRFILSVAFFPFVLLRETWKKKQGLRIKIISSLILVPLFLIWGLGYFGSGTLIIGIMTNSGLNPRTLISSFIGLNTEIKAVNPVVEIELQRIKTLQTPTPTPSPTFIVKPTSTPIPKSYDDWGKTIKIDDKTSASRFAPDDHMSTVDELNQAMNQYRQTHGLSTLNFDSLLCNIAQTRANQLQVLGKLDSHAGFSDLAHNQKTYNTMDEILFGGVQPVAGVHIVEWGWDKSLTGHHESISDPMWHDGCAGIAGYFAVFEFGAK